MTDHPEQNRPFVLRATLIAEAMVQPFATGFLRRRLAHGKEHPERWREKLGETRATRPNGQLIWFHAVGLGEVLALRGIISYLAEKRPDLNFLITSTARSSGEVVSQNLPPRTQHQFLPLDLPKPVSAFLNHWTPDLAIWTEQDYWPRLIDETAKRGIPQIVVNGRMDQKSLKKRRWLRGLYTALFSRFERILVQDQNSAENFRSFISTVPIEVTGSLKAGAAPLPVDSEELANLKSELGHRPVWVAASTHEEDEDVVINAHLSILRENKDACLILVPRDAKRGGDIRKQCHRAGLKTQLRSEGGAMLHNSQILIADSFGELGLWYRLSPVTLIGGSFGPVEGHNPWEAAALDCAILHGPRTANFPLDYPALSSAEAAIEVHDARELAAAITRTDLQEIAARAKDVQKEMAKNVTRTGDRILESLR